MRLGIACVVMGLSAFCAQAVTIDCTEGALHTAISDANAACTGQTIDFDFGTGSCNTGPTTTTIDITPDDSGGDHANRDITCAGLTIDGGGLIIFEQNPPTWDVSGVCSGDGSGCTVTNDRCPGAGQGTCDSSGHTETLLCPGDIGLSLDGTRLFDIRANNVTLKDFDVNYVEDPIHINADGATVSGITFDRCGDDCITIGDAVGTAKNNTVTGCVFQRGCNKCVQARGTKPATVTEYNLTINNCDFQSCVVPIWLEDGRMLVNGGTQFTDDLSGEFDFATGAVRAGFYSQDTWTGTMYMQDTTIDGGKHGWFCDGEASCVSLGGNTFTNNSIGGVTVCDNAKLILRRDTISNNGFGGSGNCNSHAMGGVALDQSQEADGTPAAVLGPGAYITIDGLSMTSEGGNTFTGNVAPGICASGTLAGTPCDADGECPSSTCTTAGTQECDIGAVAVSVQAERNQFEDPGVADPSAHICGPSIDASPVCLSAPCPFTYLGAKP